jgi:hypothetical protein
MLHIIDPDSGDILADLQTADGPDAMAVIF